MQNSYIERNKEWFLFQKLYVCILADVQDCWCIPQQPIQSIGQELPRKQVTNVGAFSIVLTSASTSQLLQKLNSDTRS